MKTRTFFLSLVALPMLCAVLTVLPVTAAADDDDEATTGTLVIFDFENAKAGVGGGLGDRIVPASFRQRETFRSATFSWTDPDGVFDGFTDHGVGNCGLDFPGDKAYFGRGLGPSPGFTHFVITLDARSPWVLTAGTPEARPGWWFSEPTR